MLEIRAFAFQFHTHLKTRFVSLCTVAGRCGALSEGSGVSTVKCWDCAAKHSNGHQGKVNEAALNKSNSQPGLVRPQPHRERRQTATSSAAGQLLPQAPIHIRPHRVPTCDCMLLLYTILLTM